MVDTSKPLCPEFLALKDYRMLNKFELEREWQMDIGNTLLVDRISQIQTNKGALNAENLIKTYKPIQSLKARLKKFETHRIAEENRVNRPNPFHS